MISFQALPSLICSARICFSFISYRKVADNGGRLADLGSALWGVVSPHVETMGSHDKHIRCSLCARVRCYGKFPYVHCLVGHVCRRRTGVGVDTPACRSVVRPIPQQARATRGLRALTWPVVVLTFTDSTRCWPLVGRTKYIIYRLAIKPHRARRCLRVGISRRESMTSMYKAYGADSPTCGKRA